MSSCRCKEPENVINNVCERCLLPVCLMIPSKPVASFRELKLKPRWVEDDEGTKFAGYNVVSGSITMDEPDEIYHLIEYGAVEALKDELARNKIQHDERWLLNEKLRTKQCEHISDLTQRNQELEKHVEVSELRELWLKEQRNHMIEAFSAVKDLGDKYVDEKIRLDDKAIEELSNMKKKASMDREK